MRITAIALLCLTCAPFETGAVERRQHGNLVLEDVAQIPAELAARLAPYLDAMDSLVPARHGLDQPRMALDGKGVYAISDQDSEFRQLRYLPLDGDSRSNRAAGRLSAQIPWDVEAFALSEDGRYLLYVTNEEGFSRLNLRDMRNGLDLPAPLLPLGRILDLTFSSDNARVTLGLETTRAAREVWSYDIDATRLEPPAPTMPGTLATSRFVDPLLIRYPTFDTANGKRRQIPAFVYKPRTNDSAGPFPALIWIQGGPQDQYRPGFEPFIQFLVAELGMAVIAPNARGSGGYGKTYRQLDNDLNREDAFKDIGALLAWIGQQPELDRKRVMVMGSSYGGYMSLGALMHFGDRLLGGIDMEGMSNLVTFLQQAAEDRRAALRAEYGDERDPEVRNYLRRISPFQNSQRIAKPLLVAQGLNDTDVAAWETEQMVAAIRGRGGVVWYLMAKDEGHGFRKKENRDAYLQTAATFLQKLLEDKR